MMPRLLLPSTVHVGIALSADRLVAVSLRGDGSAPWTRALAPYPPSPANETLWPDLADALQALRSTIVGQRTRATGSGHDDFRGTLHIALLPSLEHTRHVPLPGLSLNEAQQVLRREPWRYLPIPANGPALELEVEGRGWRGSSPFTLFAAPRSLVECIHAAARESGWRVAEIISAHAAWAAYAASVRPVTKNTERTLIISIGDRLEILKVRGGRVVATRRLPASATGIAALEACMLDASCPAGAGASADIALVDESPVAAELSALLREHGAKMQLSSTNASQNEPAAAVAAKFASRAAGPVLRPESERKALHRRQTRASLARFAAAAALLAVAGAVALWGTARELSVIATERARLRVPVSHAIATRDSLARIAARLATLRTVDATAPRWSALIASLSAELPENAYLLSLRADSDTLRLEGSAPRTALVLDALRHVPDVRSVRPAEAIRQEVSANGTTTEHFVLAAHLRRQP